MCTYSGLVADLLCAVGNAWCGRIWDLGTRHCIRLVTFSFFSNRKTPFWIPHSKFQEMEIVLLAFPRHKGSFKQWFEEFYILECGLSISIQTAIIEATWAAGNGEKISRGAQGLSWKSYAVDANEMTCSYWKWCKSNVAGGQSNAAEITCFLHSESSCPAPRVTLCCL